MIHLYTYTGVYSASTRTCNAQTERREHAASRFAEEKCGRSPKKFSRLIFIHFKREHLLQISICTVS